MAFRKQTLPYCVTDIAWIDIDPGTLITNISLQFKPIEIQPSAIRLYLHSGDSGNMWYVTLPAPEKGEWTQYTKPVKLSEGWAMGVNNSKNQFLLDMQSVDWAGIYVRRHSTPEAQNYNIDDFRIQGYNITDTNDTDSDGMPDAWESQYDLNMNDSSDATEDKDNDGMSNLDEYNAGTDPTSEESLLELHINVNKTEGQGINLQWSSVIDQSYSIWRTTNLIYNFEQLQSGIPGTPPVNLYEDITATNSSSYFYKVITE